MSSSRNAKATISEDGSLAHESYDASPSPQQPRDGPSKRSLRGRSGCLNCRRRRKKCDESKPSCAKCERLGEECEWDSGLSFRFTSLEADHPSMIAGQKIAATAPSLQMVDVVFDLETHECKEFLNGQEYSTAEDTHENEVSTSHENDSGTFSWDMDLAVDGTTELLPQNQTLARRFTNDHISPGMQRVSILIPESHETNNVDNSRRSNSFAAGEGEAQHHVTFQTPLHPAGDPMSTGSLPIIYEDDHLLSFSLPDLDSLDYLTNRDAFPTFGDSLWPTMSNEETNALMEVDHVPAESPDIYAMYYPNATYRELHTTLYNHMVDTARGTGLTRTGTPESDESQHSTNDQATLKHASRWEQLESARPTRSNLPKGMTVRREMELWRNYLDEIALWLDMFDNDRHFQIHLPILAQNSEPLRLSVLALSARQIERRDPDKPYTESLALYQEAIRLIAGELESMSTEVIGSCVLLCVLEMMSCQYFLTNFSPLY